MLPKIISNRPMHARSAFGLGMKHDRISPPYLRPDLMLICNMTEKFTIE